MNSTLLKKLLEACATPIATTPHRAAETLADTLHKLTPRELSAVTFRLTHGYTVRQTADVMGISRTRVQQLYASAIDKMRDALCPPTPAEKRARREAQEARKAAAIAREDAEHEQNRLAALEEQRQEMQALLEAERARRLAEQTKRELAELARLKAKYERSNA